MFSHTIINEFVKLLDQFSDNKMEIYIMDYTGRQLYGNGSTHYKLINEHIHQLKMNKEIIFNQDGKDAILTNVMLDTQPLIYILSLGNLDEIKPIIGILKMAMELRIKYDDFQHKMKEERTVKGKIIKYLLEEPEINTEILQKLMEKGNYSIKVPRILLIFELNSDYDMNVIKTTNFYFDSYEDIVSIYEGNITILKDISFAENKEKTSIRNYLSTFITHIRQNTVLKDRAFISALSTNITNYKLQFDRLKWMIESINNYAEIQNKKNFFFMDYFNIYIMSQVPESIYVDLFEGIKEDSGFDEKEFLQIMPALIRNNFNIAQSSKELFLHRNTLLYRVEKIKKIMEIDPINSEIDRTFLKLLYFNLYTDLGKGGKIHGKRI